MRGLLLLLIFIAVLVGTVWAGQFGYGPVIITNEHEYKLILTGGAPVREPILEPGITFHVPFVETVVTLDKRLQHLNAEPREIVIGNQTMIVDYYAVWRITDPLVFRRSFPTYEIAQLAIRGRLRSEVGAAVGRLEVDEILSRGQVLDEMETKLTEELAGKGVEVVDVRINRTELPKEAEVAAYEQMREQRNAIAREYRAKGDREAREIRARAERKARTILAEARSVAEQTRGEGDAGSAAIYAAAYSKDPQFYAFIRSLAAYRTTLKDHTTLVLAPDHEFFRFLGGGTAAVGAPPVEPAAGSAADR